MKEGFSDYTLIQRNYVYDIENASIDNTHPNKSSFLLLAQM